MRFAAVIFDMDGTLLDTEALIIGAGLHAMEVHGLPLRRDVLTSMVGTVGDTGDRLLFDAYGPGLDLDALNETWRAEAARRYAESVPLRPGADTLLDRLAHLGLPFALATNSRTSHAHESLARAGIAHRFEQHLIFGRDRVARPKPAPDLFLHAAETLSVPPGDCLVFEDSDAGVTAAHAAGMTVVLVPDQRPPDTSLAHHTAPSLMAGAAWAGLAD